jgi:ATP-dependent Zn protease
MVTNELYQVAIHEAGHAVMAVINKRKLKTVTIKPNESDDSGCCEISFNRPKIEDIFILLAGLAAEKTLSGFIEKDKVLYGGQDDLTKVYNLACSICPSNSVHEFLDDMFSATEDIMKLPLVHQQIKNIADNLLQHKTLSGAEVQKIMKEVEVS